MLLITQYKNFNSKRPRKEENLRVFYSAMLAAKSYEVTASGSQMRLIALWVKYFCMTLCCVIERRLVLYGACAYVVYITYIVRYKVEKS